MKEILSILLVLTCSTVFSQTIDKNIVENTTIDTIVRLNGQIDSCEIDSLQNIDCITKEAQNGKNVGFILFLLLVLGIIVIWIIVFQKNKKELAEIDAHLANAESAIIARNSFTAEHELGKVVNRIKESDTQRRKKLLELLSRLEILNTNIRFDTCSEQLEFAIITENILTARAEWAKIKDIKVVDSVRKAKQEKLSLQLETLKMVIDIDSHLNNAESALRLEKVITARAELDVARSLMKKISDARRNYKLEDLSLQLDALETKLKKETAEQLKNVRKEVENGQFIDIETIKKRIQPTATPETPKEIQNVIKSFVGEVEEQYEKGIIPKQTLDYVQYNATKLTVPNKDGYYCYTLFPPQNTILFPYRRKKSRKTRLHRRVLPICIKHGYFDILKSYGYRRYIDTYKIRYTSL